MIVPTPSTKQLKLLVLLGVGLGVLIVSIVLRPSHASAGTEDPVDEIASYRTWTKVTKEPIKGAALDVIELNAAAGG